MAKETANMTIFETVQILPLALSVALAYFLSICFYNIFMHPLRKIPGPVLAKIGPYLEFYHEVIRDGQYLWEIEKMHEKYGPIVRVNAREVHIKDSSYYHTIYTAGARRTDKDPPTVGAFDVPNATAATVPHDLHRARRGYLNPYFSKKAIVGLEPTIHERIGQLLLRFEEYMIQNQVLTLDGAFSALTADIITSRFYGKHFDYLAVPGFHFVVRDAFPGLCKVYHLARFMPDVVGALKSLPYSIIRKILPSVVELLVMRDEIKRNGVDEFTKSKTPDSKSSVLVGALSDPHIPAHERTVGRMLDEGTVFLFAGTETTSRTLSVTMFYLLRHPDILQRLREELKTLPPSQDNMYSLAQLEPLPYMSGVVNEGFRLSFGPISRSSRVAPDIALEYKDYVIPPGTPLSQSTYFVHTDPEIYPNPDVFDPERWIKAADEGVNLNKFVTNFSKGSRQCIGYTMSFAEMYLTLSRLVLAYDLQLYDTNLQDVDVTHARIVGFPKAVPGRTEGLGEIQVKVNGRLA